MGCFDIRTVQEALGNGSLKTTDQYLHISNNAMKHLKGPLD